MGRIINCIDCGGEFWSEEECAERSTVCRVRHKRERGRMWNNSPYRKRKRQKHRGYVPSVEEFMHDCAEYNREYGTNLNYGTYDRLLRRKRGELTVEVKL